MDEQQQQQHPLAGNSAQHEKKQPQVFNERDRVVLATPCYGGMVRYEFMNSIMALRCEPTAMFRMEDGTVQELPIVASWVSLDRESHIDRARNKLANVFMRATKYNRLLWIDADVESTPQDLAALWIHSMNGREVVCGAYATKSVVPQFAVNVAPGSQPMLGGLVEVIDAGTGYMMLSRSVFEKFEREGKADEYELGRNDPDFETLKTHRAYFKSGVRPVKLPNGRETKLWLSEDYMLCYEWRKMGGKVYIDRRLQLGHIGTIKFPVSAKDAKLAYAEFDRIGAYREPGEPARPVVDMPAN